MRIPSPDAVLVGAAEWLARLAQHAGLPLPLFLAAFPRALVGCAVAEGAVLAARGHAGLLALMFLPGLAAVHVAVSEARTYGRDAASWDADMAARYARRAMECRARGGGERGAYAAVAFMAALWCVLAVLNGFPGAGGFVADAGLIAAAMVVLAGRSYALCARPASPAAGGARDLGTAAAPGAGTA